MIYFSFSATTPILVVTLCVFLLLFFLSFFLNPAVFAYNKKKSSVAGLLYSILSAADFLFSLSASVSFFYHASTVKIKDLECAGVENSTTKSIHLIQPQNCLMLPSRLVSIISTIIGTLLNTTVFLTTAMLAVVRSIQILHPFYPVQKWRAFGALIVLVAIQTGIHSIHVIPLSSRDQTYFFPSMMVSMNDLDPLNLNLQTSGHHQISTAVQNSILTLMQLVAVLSCVVTAVFLIRKRDFNRSRVLDEERLKRERKIFKSAVKVMMTNLVSFLLVLLLGTPLFFLVVQADFEDEGPVAETMGWVQFWVVIILPMFSSVWNPVVFLSLTPKSRMSIQRLWRIFIRG